MQYEDEPGDRFSDELSEPHFDEERTLLSAKPVVPLSQVQASRRIPTLPLAYTILAAAILGAMAATLLYSKRSASSATVEKTVEAGVGTQQSQPQETKVESVENADVPMTSIAETEGSLNEFENPEPPTFKKVAETKPNDSAARPKAKLVGVIREKRVESRKQERETDSGDVREERRPRRVGGLRSHVIRERSDDLFRIGDIFEGSDRP